LSPDRFFFFHHPSSPRKASPPKSCLTFARQAFLAISFPFVPPQQFLSPEVHLCGYSGSLSFFLLQEFAPLPTFAFPRMTTKVDARFQNFSFPCGKVYEPYSYPFRFSEYISPPALSLPRKRSLLMGFTFPFFPAVRFTFAPREKRSRPLLLPR